MGRPHTSDSWQKPLPVCHLRLETLQLPLSQEGQRICRLVSTQRGSYA
jgi:hypothetical protein